jgi:ABC-type sugar transport system ATPase subunit
MTWIYQNGCRKTIPLCMMAILDSFDYGKIILDGENRVDFPTNKHTIAINYRTYLPYSYITEQGIPTFGLEIAEVS